MQDQTGYAVLAAGFTIWWGVLVALAVTMKPKGPRRWTVIVIALTGVCAVAQLLAIFAKWNVLGDAMIFVATIAGCTALVGGVVFYMRSRSQTVDDLTQAAPTQQNYVTPGTQPRTQYAAEAPAMRKRGRF